MKQVGILSFFPAFNPPRSGGELRLHHMAMYLARHGWDVQMAAPTFGDAAQEVLAHHPHFTERRYPRTRAYNAGHAFMDRVARFRECSGLVCSLVARRHEALRVEAERLAATSDVLTQESPFLAPLVPRRRKPGQLLVYNSYNVEAKMAADMFGTSWQGRLATAWITRLERQLLRESDIVLACSDEDADLFVRQFGVERARIVLAPNGVDVDAIRPCSGEEQRAEARARLRLSPSRPACFFIGSFHPPNIEAVDFLLHRIAPRLPEADFLIAGKVCDAFQGRALPENLRLLGLIDEPTKLALLHGTDVAVNPMLSGSGTNLKMLDFMAAGLPCVTTPHGARGLRLENRRHALVRPAETFLEGLEEILADATQRADLGAEARALVEREFSWESIGARVANLYDLKTGRRVVLLNDYPVHPAEQGGQVRVEAVARQLARQGNHVTLLTLTREDTGRRLDVAPGVEELNVPRTFLHRQMDGVLSALVGCGADDVSALLLTRWLTPGYGRLLQQELQRADRLVLCHPYMQPVAAHVGRGKKQFYDSHNTEWDLKQKLYRPSRWSRLLIDRVRRAEVAAVQQSEAVFCVSEENREQLRALVPALNGRAYVSPNGVDCSRVRVRPFEERRALRRDVGFGREYVAVFLGSGHPPNAEAARIIIEKIAPEHSRVLFLLVGSVCGWFWNRHLPGNVLVMGIVSTEVKNFLLQVSDFALNPMLTGSGTSLKLFDYMAAGLPVLSTAVGARGLDDEAMKAVVLLEVEEFSAGLRRLLADGPRCEELASLARRTAEERFDWRVALRDMERVNSPEG